MRIKLAPQRRDDTLEVSKSGNILTLNGVVFDLSPMTEGSTLPNSAIDSEWFAGDVELTGGEMVVTLLLPLPQNYSQEQAFPDDLIAVPDGPVVFPKPLPSTDMGLDQ
jgi:hypothetical protein